MNVEFEGTGEIDYSEKETLSHEEIQGKAVPEELREIMVEQDFDRDAEGNEVMTEDRPNLEQIVDHKVDSDMFDMISEKEVEKKKK